MKKPKAVRAVEKIDRDVAKEAAKVRDTPVVRTLGALSELADQPPLATICVSVLGAGLVSGDARLARAGGRMLLGFAVATTLKALVKRSIDRTRPLVAEEFGYTSRRGTRNEGPWNSFPSGHTAGALAVTRSLAREYPDTALAGAAATAVVAAVQLPRGRHYATDIVTGAAIGFVAERASNALFDYLSAAFSASARSVRSQGK